MQAGLANLSAGRMYGVQAGLFNGGNCFGICLGVFGNTYDDSKGIQVGLMNSNLKSFSGIQVGLTNMVGFRIDEYRETRYATYVKTETKSTHYTGATSAGLLIGGGNLTMRHDGVQIAPLFNYNKQELNGAQVSLVNTSGDVNGAQIGALNIAEDVKGVQIGAINVARRLEGIQIGGINIAYKNGLPVMLLVNAGW